jgi:mono/diheme cytochrome c family protein
MSVLVALRRSVALVALAGASFTAVAADDALAARWGFIDQYCGTCHNATDWAGGLALDGLQPDAIHESADTWEEVVRKLRGNLMPPPGEQQPAKADREAFVLAMETALDREAGLRPDPGTKPLHRLNKPEYRNAVREILGVEVEVDELLPRDDQSAGFDNSAEVLKISPAFLEQYISAARQVSLLALGNPRARSQSRVYPGSWQASQYMHIEGLPLGTRGGMVIDHEFPVDGDYELTISGLVGAGYLWGVLDPRSLVVTLDGRRVYEAGFGDATDLDAVDLQQAAGVGAINDRFRNIPFRTTAGRHRIGIAFRQKTAAESNETLHAFNPVEGMAVAVNGVSGGPRISNVEINGPLAKGGVALTEARRRLLICEPANAADERPCAEKILGRVARLAFRRPVDGDDLRGPLRFFEEGRAQGGFETGLQKGLVAILASPKFLFRMHSPPAGARPGDVFTLQGLDLASRLAFFLWSGPPDEALIEVAAQGGLADPAVREAQVRRMLAHPRARTLVTNFAFQWLNIKGLELVNPDPNIFPEYTDDLIPAFRRELELFMADIFERDASVVELLTGEYSFLNERLAIHYGMHDVRGGQFRRLRMPQSWRRGLLGKGAILMTTSYANRTTPVLRGSYVLEKILGTPPAAPPPNVEAFPESQEGEAQQTVRARLEQHRSVKGCNGCHGVIDPPGLALENFNAIGQWRDKDVDAAATIDAAGRFADGAEFTGPDDLRAALVARSDMFVMTFSEHLLGFALGRAARHADMPLLRRIVRDAAREDYRLSAIVLGIVESPAFLQDRVPDAAASPLHARRQAAGPNH